MFGNLPKRGRFIFGSGRSGGCLETYQNVGDFYLEVGGRGGDVWKLTKKREIYIWKLEVGGGAGCLETYQKEGDLYLEAGGRGGCLETYQNVGDFYLEAGSRGDVWKLTKTWEISIWKRDVGRMFGNLPKSGIFLFGSGKSGECLETYQKVGDFYLEAGGRGGMFGNLPIKKKVSCHFVSLTVSQNRIHSSSIICLGRLLFTLENCFHKSVDWI